MSTQTEITRLQNAKSSIKTAIEGKGVTVPDSTKLDGMAALIDSISSGGGSSSETWVLAKNYEGTSIYVRIPTVQLDGRFVSNGQEFVAVLAE